MTSPYKTNKTSFKTALLVNRVRISTLMLDCINIDIY